MFKGTALTFILAFFTIHLSAQELQPKGGFLQDSIKIGVPVGFSLAVKYPRDLDIIFPDSLYKYESYEFYGKEYFPTRSDSLFSYDSAVYYFTSFEVDSIQTLKLPIFVLHGRDSTAIFTAPDTVFLQQMVTDIPDTVTVETIPLRENTDYKEVTFAFNYPYFIIAVLLLVLLATIVLVFFGAKIKKYFVLKRMARLHRKFVERFDSLSSASDYSPHKKAERILVVWKQYLERLESRPYTKLTTKEIINYYQPANIEAALRDIDRLIYGNETPDGALSQDYTMLKAHAQLKYEQKAEEVKNG